MILGYQDIHIFRNQDIRLFKELGYWGTKGIVLESQGTRILEFWGIDILG